jgi:hypothetical protein
LQKEIKKKL